MRKQDWSLVLFTTLSQLSVGMILFLTMLVYFSGDTAVIVEKGFSLRNPVLLALLIVAVATTSSFLHLGNPSNAPRALNNLSGSWLSREILILGMYSLSLLIILVAEWTVGSDVPLKLLMLLSCMLGVALLWMMIKIYTVPTIPAWNSWYTSLSFISTAICFGLLAILILDQIGWLNTSDQVITKTALALAVILLIEFVSGYLNQRRLKTMNTGIENLVFDRGLFYGVFLSRMAFLIIALLAILAITYQPGFFSSAGVYPWIFLLVTLVFVQEIMGRFLFYSSYFRVGV